MGLSTEEIKPATISLAPEVICFFFYGKLAIKFDNYVLVKKTNSLLQKK